MSSAVADAPKSPSSRSSASTPCSPAAGANGRLEAVRVALKQVLSDPVDPSAVGLFRALRQEAAREIARLPKRQLHSREVDEARALVRTVCSAGVQDEAVAADDVALATELLKASPGGPGLLAAMLLLPAWQWPDAPVFAQVPDLLWGDYAHWVFSSPQGFCEPGQVEIFAAHTLKRLEELSGWVQRNSGSGTVRAALDAYLQTASAIPLYFSEDSLRRHAEVRGRLLTKAISAHRDTYAPSAESRYGRKLRVGFVNRHFGSQTETYTTLPTFEQLDADRFEVILFAHRMMDSPLEAYCRQHAQEFHLLPSDATAQLSNLREANLDVIVFGTNVTAVFNEVTRLALYRSAPLQVVNNSSCITSGFPHVDLYVSGKLTETNDAAAHFSERLALLPGPAHAFNYQADREEPTRSWTRAALGVPEDAVLFVTAANYYKIIPEMQIAWARLLASVPGSYLLVHPFNPNWSSSYPIQRFCAGFDRVLAAHGVDTERLRVSTERFPSRSDVKALLAVGDIYLDTFPFGGVNSLVDPLELGIPTVAWEGSTFRSRMGSALLRQLGLEPLIATNEADYLGIARALASDPAVRESFKQKIVPAMERSPLFLDPLAASDAFGDILETAYDALAESGAEAFRAARTPLESAVPTPIDTGSRHLHGLELLTQGRAERAAEYLTAAVQHDENNPALWLDVSRAYRAAGQAQLAIQALEASLRIDATCVDAWIMLVELAEAVGMTELAREALDCVKELSPNDARVRATAKSGQAYGAESFAHLRSLDLGPQQEGV